MEFLNRLAAILPPPRIHRHRYHGVFAPNAPLRPLVAARAEAENAALAADLASQQPAIPEPAATPEGDPASHEGSEGSGSSSSPRPSKWAALLARIYEAFPLVCPTCGGSLTLIAFAFGELRFAPVLTDPEPISRVLGHIGEPTRPPLLHPARGPPQAEFDLGGDSGHGTPRTTGQHPFDLNQSPEFDAADPEPVPDFEFDQSREGEHE